MPFEWVNDRKEAPEISGASFHAKGGPALAVLHVWPHRSLPKKGFVWFIGATFVLIMLPLALMQVGGLGNASRELAQMTPPHVVTLNLELADTAEFELRKADELRRVA